MSFTALDARIQGTRLIYLHDDVVFNATYMVPAAEYADLQPLIEYSFGTFSATSSEE